ncbi:hypothetical protein [Desulfosporosinus sp. Sb-LF]|uniref:hypothetical protein n=1 Tax=Desulfosporosinus sp. Sb-LF TaxID=2560027 RepID=UPI00107FC9FF|nr:hypothetical protein [Desulfosporosinus sp. Sb-LF]TGE31771.1 hypothetical protein E4K68_15320 [Desulfosporosinus sp. Sb-LF]
MKEKLFRTDTKALVGAVIIGIVFVIMEQVTGRIDAILDPTLLLLNGTCWAFFTGLIVLMYKQPAGIIAGLVEAIVAMATAYSPLAFFFIFANTIGSITYSLIARNFSMEKLSHHILAMIGCNITGNLCVMAGLIYVIHLDWKIALLSSSITALVGTIVAGILTKSVYGALQKSSLLS